MKRDFTKSKPLSLDVVFEDGSERSYPVRKFTQDDLPKAAAEASESSSAEPDKKDPRFSGDDGYDYVRIALGFPTISQQAASDASPKPYTPSKDVCFELIGDFAEAMNKSKTVSEMRSLTQS